MANMAGTLIPIILVAAVLIGLVVWKLSAGAGVAKKKQEFLERQSFAPCKEQADYLVQMYQYMAPLAKRGQGKVESPLMRSGARGQTYYFYYTETSRREGGFGGEEVFLLPLQRATTAPVALLLVPGNIKGMGRNVIKAAFDMFAKFLGEDLVEIELPPDADSERIVAAFGPPGSSLYDLLDRDTVARVARSADAGVSVFRAREKWAMAGLFEQYRVNVAEVWAALLAISKI